MKEPVSGSYRYQVGGALGKDVPSYVTRVADRQFYEALQGQEFCYVLNSRQMGKSSLMVRTLDQLKSEGWAGIVLDFSAKDSQIDQPDRWYNGIINQMNRHFGLLDNARSWLKERDFLSPVERLEEFIKTVLLPGINQPIVIFIDEIDSTLNLPFTDDFFALIRACYNKRAETPDYQRLTFALLGVATPSELISDKKRTPFNIGQAIDLKGFDIKETQPLVKGLAGKAENAQAVMQEILNWTGGQPFLTQRLCQLMVDTPDFISVGKEVQSVEQLARTRLIENWEFQDEQEHLKTIRNRLLSNEQKAGYLLELYRQILRQDGKLKSQNTSEERDLQLSGLVVKRDDHFTVYNRIYELVFNEQWIDAELGILRPYAENFRAWLASEGSDKSRLLRGKALQDAEEWAKGKNLSYQDRQFLAASREKEIEAKIAAKDKEAVEERNNLLADANWKAQWRIRVGTAIFILTLLVVVILGIQAKKSQEYVQTVEKLAKLAEKLENEGSNNVAKELFSQAAQSVNVQDDQSRLALLYLGISLANQEIKNKQWETSKYYLIESEKLLKINTKKNSLQDDLQIQVILLKTKGNFFKKHNQKKEAIIFYKKAFDIINKFNLNPFDNNLKVKILSKENLESIHRDLLNLLPLNDPNKMVIRESLKNLYLRELENLLINNKWQEANSQTKKIMLFLSKRETEGWFDIESLNNFNCKDLRKIDEYWKKYSRDYFGFSVQKNIYNNLSKDVDDFGERVGWYDKQRDWINHQYSDLPPNSPTFEKYAKKGHLPFLEDGRNWVGVYIISNRCSTIYKVAKDIFITECKVDPKIRINILYTHVERCKL